MWEWLSTSQDPHHHDQKNSDGSNGITIIRSIIEPFQQRDCQQQRYLLSVPAVKRWKPSGVKHSEFTGPAWARANLEALLLCGLKHST